MKKYDFNSISKGRSFLMGIAALWIMVYHSGVPFLLKDGNGFKHIIYILGYYNYLFKSLGQTGVDIALFLSAIGLYYSLEKNDDVKEFYSRRIRRALPAYLLVNLLWEIYTFKSVLQSIFHILGISLFTEGYRNNWFFTLIFFLYLIFPPAYRLYKRNGEKGIIVLIILDLAFNYVFSLLFPELFLRCEILLRRIPVFLLGLLFSKTIKENKKTNPFIVLFIALLGLALSFSYLSQEANITSRLYRYIESVFGITVIIPFSYLYDYVKEGKLFRKITQVIEWCGNYSMETYLLYEKLLVVIEPLIGQYGSLCLAIIGAILCFLLVKPLRRFNSLFS